MTFEIVNKDPNDKNYISKLNRGIDFWPRGHMRSTLISPLGSIQELPIGWKSLLGYAKITNNRIIRYDGNDITDDDSNYRIEVNNDIY